MGFPFLAKLLAALSGIQISPVAGEMGSEATSNKFRRPMDTDINL